MVGLTFESTTGEGGDGPAFAVGNTHQDGTEKVAAAPKLVPKEVVNKGPTTVTPNKMATRVPMAGVTFTQPKLKKRVEPSYPATLKTKGEPATRNGEPIPYSPKYTISFRLKDE